MTRYPSYEGRWGGDDDPNAPQPQPQPLPEPERRLRPVLDPPYMPDTSTESTPLSPETEEWLRKLTEDL